MPNRLAQETSLYLRQHQENPIDWLPWGDEAFERAKQEDKPVFLSVGYSSCHWCHVMAHESFEDEEVASLLNRNFVSIKVDREEQPDVDEAYMAAVQLQSGRGGWPMSVFLTPDRAPFFAGTYFPKDNRGGHPGFLRILRELEGMWRAQRPKVLEAAGEFRKALLETMGRPAPKTFRTLDLDFVQEAFAGVAADFDPVNGGFGGAPKFPPHSAIELGLAMAESDAFPEGPRSQARTLALTTLEKMCLGGIHDHVGGGFHRYSVDDHWLVPHFEKMLYDNALILRNLALAEPLASGAQRAIFESARKGIVRWLESEMISEDGLLCSALDADSEGEEGKFYVWTTSEVREALGAQADAFLAAYRLEESGNFHDEATGRMTGANIPHLGSPASESLANELAFLRERRESRPRPMRDDKALIGWNGLALAGLSAAGEAALVERLIAALERIVPKASPLPHQVAFGQATGIAYLEDVAGWAWGLSALGQDPSAHLDALIEFEDIAAGDYFAVSGRHEELFGRAKPVFDQPIPSANALAARAMVRAGRLDRARQIVEANLGWIERAPGATEALLLAGLEVLAAEGLSIAPILAKPGRPVSVSAVPGSWKRVDPQMAAGQIEIEVGSGFHINSPAPELKWLKPTQVTSKAGPVEASFPPAIGDRLEGIVRVGVEVRTPEDRFELSVEVQACTESECLEAEALRVQVDVVP